MSYLPIDFLDMDNDFISKTESWIKSKGRRYTFNLIMNPRNETMLSDFTYHVGSYYKDNNMVASMLIYTLIKMEWSERKISLRPDKSMYDYLVENNHVISSKIIEVLPCQCFFLDFSRLDFLGQDVGGCFVETFQRSKGLDIALCIVKKCSNFQYFTTTLYLPYNEDKTELRWCAAGKDESSQAMWSVLFCIFTYYLDIKTNRTVEYIVKDKKKVYKIRNNRSQSGVRVSSPIVRAVKKYSYKEDTENNPNREKRPIASHYRSGHIHHYWVGRGSDKKLIAKWVAGVNVKGTKENTSEVVIHDIRA